MQPIPRSVSERRSAATTRTRAVATLAATVVAAGLSLAGASSASAADSTGPGVTLQCNASTVYVQNAAGEVRAFDVDDYALADVPVLSGQESNGLGIGSGGTSVYTLHNGNPSGATKKLAVYDTATGTTVTDIGDANVPGTIIRGAVDPTNGLYYYSGSGSSSGHYLGVVDPSTGVGVRVGAITGMTGTNGDFAFTSSGELIVVADRNVYRLNGAVPTVAGEQDLTTTLIATLPTGTAGNGIAFGKNGNLFISSSTGGNSIFEVNPATGVLLSTTSLGSFTPTDMASCSFPNTASLQVDVDERVNPGDQFTVTIGGPDYVTENAGSVATTTGAATGIQGEAAGPVFVQPGDELTLTISPSGDTNLEDYDLVPQCTDATSGQPLEVTGSAPHWTITQPAGTNGSTVVCTVTVTPAVAESTVTVEHVDEDGKPLAEAVASTGKVGDDYTSAPKEIPGYVLVTTPANANGEYAAEDTTVTYVYAKVSTVTVEHVDQDGKPLAEAVASTGKVGDDYTSAPKEIPGYVLVTTPANANGEYAAEDTTVTYVYAKVPAVVPTAPAGPGAAPAGPGVNTGGSAADGSAAVWGWVTLLSGGSLALLAGGAFALLRRRQVQ